MCYQNCSFFLSLLVLLLLLYALVFSLFSNPLFTRRERIIPRNNNNVRNKKWWDSWKNPRFFEKKFDSIFFFLFFRKRPRDTIEREWERESVHLTRVCVLSSFPFFFEVGEKSSLHTHVYIIQHTHTHTHIYLRRRQR